VRWVFNSSVKCYNLRFMRFFSHMQSSCVPLFFFTEGASSICSLADFIQRIGFVFVWQKVAFAKLLRLPYCPAKNRICWVISFAFFVLQRSHLLKCFVFTWTLIKFSCNLLQLFLFLWWVPNPLFCHVSYIVS